jgi:hypothetical protein
MVSQLKTHFSGMLWNLEQAEKPQSFFLVCLAAPAPPAPMPPKQARAFQNDSHTELSSHPIPRPPSFHFHVSVCVSDEHFQINSLKQQKIKKPEIMLWDTLGNHII